MPEVEEEFQHTVEVWTVGDLKKALADIADDTKLIFSTADEPGSDLAGPEQVAFSAGTITFYDSGVRERRVRRSRCHLSSRLAFTTGAYGKTANRDRPQERHVEIVTASMRGEMETARCSGRCGVRYAGEAVASSTAGRRGDDPAFSLDEDGFLSSDTRSDQGELVPRHGRLAW